MGHGGDEGVGENRETAECARNSKDIEREGMRWDSRQSACRKYR